MAKSLNGATKVNPRYYKGPHPQTISVLPTDTVTYNAGDLGYYDTVGLARPCASDPANVDFIFNNTRSTAATSTRDQVSAIEPDTQFVWFVTAAGTDAAATQAMVGSLYTIILDTASSAYVLDTDTAGSHDQDPVKIDALLKDKEPYRHALADSPGQVIGHIIASKSRDAS